jgi:hypothetical protein
MVIQPHPSSRRRGVFEVDMLVALALLFVVAIPLMCSFATDARALRAHYEHAVAMECLDGELEILAAGGWRNHPLGTNEITLSGGAAKNLHPATARIIREPHMVRVEWQPAGRSAVFRREVALP